MGYFSLVISIVSGVLSLILFFKVWGMCNNVSKIKKKMNCDIKSLSKYYIVIGDNEKAYEALCKEMFLNLNASNGSIMPTIDGTMYSIPKYISEYKKLFDMIGKEIPENLSTEEKIKNILRVTSL